MTFGKIAALVSVAVLTLVVNVAATFLYMALYGYVIDPGHDPKYYEEHVQFAAPYCSIVVGIPLMFFVGWWVAGWWNRNPGVKAALIVWLAYFAIDLAIMLAAGIPSQVVVLFVVSFVTKLIAAYLGARWRLRST